MFKSSLFPHIYNNPRSEFGAVRIVKVKCCLFANQLALILPEIAAVCVSPKPISAIRSDCRPLTGFGVVSLLKFHSQYPSFLLQLPLVDIVLPAG